MHLNLPFQLKNRTLLIAGAGGGWDVFGGLPLAYQLRADNRIVLANYSSVAGGFDTLHGGLAHRLHVQQFRLLFGNQLFERLRHLETPRLRATAKHVAHHVLEVDADFLH